MAENYVEDVIAPLMAPIARAGERVRVTAAIDARAGTESFTVVSNDDAVRVRLLIDGVPTTAFVLRDPYPSASTPPLLLTDSEPAPAPDGWRTLWRGSGDFRGEHGLSLAAFDTIYLELTHALRHAARVCIEVDAVIPSMGPSGVHLGGWVELRAAT